MALGNGNDNINIDGGTSPIVDFGGDDTYTLLGSLSADVTITDVDGGTVNLPAGLDVTSTLFLADGVQFEINGFTVTILGVPGLMTFVFGGTPLDPTAGTPLGFEDTAAAFGTTVPAAGDPPNAGTNTGEINDDGTVGDAGLTPEEIYAEAAQAAEDALDAADAALAAADDAEAAVVDQATADAYLAAAQAAQDAANDAAVAAQAAVDAAANTDDGDVDDAEAAGFAADAAAAQAAADAEVANAEDVVANAPNPGQTFTLTENADIIPGLIGSNGDADTSGDDLIIAGTSFAGGKAINNLGAGDVLDPGEGFNTLKIINQSGSDLIPNMQNVHRIDIQPIENTNVNLINSKDVQQAWIVDDPNDNNVDVFNIGQDAIIGIQNSVGSDYDADFLAGAIQDGAFDIALIDAPGSELDADSPDPIDTINFLIGGDKDSGAELESFDNTIRTVTVSDFPSDPPGTGNFFLKDNKGENTLDDVTTLDSTGFSNNFTADLGDNDNDVDVDLGNGTNDILLGDGNNDILGGTGNDLINVGDGNNTISTGDRADVITVGGTKADNGIIDVDAGAGDDILNAGTTLTEDDAADGGEGDKDRLNVDVDVAAALSKDDESEDTILNWEVLGLDGEVKEGERDRVNLDNLNEIKHIDVGGVNIVEGQGVFEMQTIEITGPADANGGCVIVAGVEVEIAPNATQAQIAAAIVAAEADILAANPDLAAVELDGDNVKVTFGVTGDQANITVENSTTSLASGVTFSAPPAEVTMGVAGAGEVQSYDFDAVDANGTLTVTLPDLIDPTTNMPLTVDVDLVVGDGNEDAAQKVADALDAAFTAAGFLTGGVEKDTGGFLGVLNDNIVITYPDGTGPQSNAVFDNVDAIFGPGDGPAPTGAGGAPNSPAGANTAEVQTVEITGPADGDGGLVEVEGVQIEVDPNDDEDAVGAKIAAAEADIIAANPAIANVDYNTATNLITFTYVAGDPGTTGDGNQPDVLVEDSMDTKDTGAMFMVVEAMKGVAGDIDGELELNGVHNDSTLILGGSTANQGLIDVNLQTDTDADKLNIEIGADQAGDLDVDHFEELMFMDLVDGQFALPLTTNAEVDTVTATGEGAIFFNNSFGNLTLFDGTGAGGGFDDTGFFVDTLTGDDATLLGGSDDDIFSTSDGNDILSGNDGDDNLTGFGGADTKTGGAGADIFTYQNVTDSSGLAIDTITDFTTGEDFFNFIALLQGGLDDVVYLGEVASVAAANTALDDMMVTTDLQVVFNTTTGELLADVDLSGDIDDGDLVINLTGVTTLDQGDFLN